MPRKKENLYIGTSGWMYKHWDKSFYPQEIKDREKLAYYSSCYKTVEINTTFYHFAKKQTYVHWHENSAKDFVFSVKMNRRFTHTKRLILDEQTKNSLQLFFDSVQELKEKLGAVLIQLPPSAKANPERLDVFLEFCKTEINKRKYKSDFAIEFRHETWFMEEVYQILKKHNVALVIANEAKFPYAVKLTADFTYIRFHGPNQSYLGLYSEEEMKKWADIIENFRKKIKKSYIYFNNDLEAHAIINSRYLKEIMNAP